jgi:hypothetical protein
VALNICVFLHLRSHLQVVLFGCVALGRLLFERLQWQREKGPGKVVIRLRQTYGGMGGGKNTGILESDRPPKIGLNWSEFDWIGLK